MRWNRGHNRRGGWRGLLTAVLALVAIAVGAAAPPLPVLRAGAPIDHPPLSDVDANGRPVGFAIDLMRAVVAAVGRDVTFTAGAWVDVQASLAQQRVQVLPLVERTVAREEVFDFTIPYLSLQPTLVVRRDGPDVHTLADLADRPVAVMQADTTEAWLRGQPRDFPVVAKATFSDALGALLAGDCAAAVMPRRIAQRLLRDPHWRDLHELGAALPAIHHDCCFAVCEGDRQTLNLLNQGLALVMADGTYRRLHAKWFSDLQTPRRQVVVVGGDRDFPPFEYLDEHGQPAGFNVDLTRAIARELELDVVVNLSTWETVRDGLTTGRVDIIEGMFYSGARDLAYDFSPPYTVTHYVSVVRRGQGPPPATLEDLFGRQLVVQRGDIMNDFVVQTGLDENLAAADSQGEALRQLAAGQHDCALVARLTALYWIEKLGLENLEVGRQPLVSPDYCFAALPGQGALLAQFNEGLRLVKENGEYRRISNRWLGVYEEGLPSLRSIVRVLVTVTGLLLVLVGLFLMWSWSLRRQVARRTVELRESEAKYRLLAENAADVIWVYDLTANRYTYVSPAIEAMFGWSVEEAMAMGIGKHIPAETMAWLRQTLRDRLGSDGMGARKVTLEFEQRHRDGHGIWTEVALSMIRAEDGRPAGLQGITRDITARKRGELRIEHLNRVLRAIRDVNQLVVHEQDAARLIHEGCRLLVEGRGYAAALIVRPGTAEHPAAWAEAGFGPTVAPLAEQLARGREPACCAACGPAPEVAVVRRGAASCRACTIAAACADRDVLCTRLGHDTEHFGYLAVVVESGLELNGEERSLLAEIAGDFAYALHGIEVAAARQQSERQREALEEQLFQAQKMEAVGRLAGGVAHDFNNMLGIILGYAEMALELLPPDDPLREKIEPIRQAGHRSAELTRQLLAFARRQPIAPRVLDLNDTVSGMLKMLGRLIGEHIHLEWRPGPDVWAVNMDPGQIDQLLANLVVNARDAIGEAGRITIETGNAHLGAAAVSRLGAARPGDYVLLAVADDGCGMDRVTLKSIFEPFFTTKPPGEGTGLGLATVYGIVRQNGGMVDVTSSPGAGSTFRIYLPRCEETVSEGSEEVKPALPTGTETILVAEDEPTLLDLTTELLEELGYRVLPVAEPERAVVLAEDPDRAIDLLLTDVVMPGMGGRQLWERLAMLRPELRCLFMSGYTADAVVDHGVQDDQVHFIEKPFTMSGLAAAVRAALDDAR